MKWSFLTLLFLAGVVAAYQPVKTPILADGAATLRQGEYCVVPNWPVYDYFRVAGTFFVNITNPLDNTTYWHNTENITLDISGGHPPYICQYRIDEHLWNVWDCSDKQVTFPEGENTLQVEVTDNTGATGSDAITFTVTIFEGNNLWAGRGLPFLVFVLVYLIFFAPGRKSDVFKD